MFELLQINNEISNKRCSTLQINIWEVQINKDIQIKDVALHINIWEVQLNNDIQIKDVALHINIWEVQLNNDMLQINSELQIKFENSKKKFRILSKKLLKHMYIPFFTLKGGTYLSINMTQQTAPKSINYFFTKLSNKFFYNYKLSI